LHSSLCIFHSGYEHKRVCKEGPVFDAGEVIFDEDLLSGH
jgi:NAD(P)H-flavin reductase